MTQTFPSPDVEACSQEVLETHGVCACPVNLISIAALEEIVLLPGGYDGCFDGRIECRHREGRPRFYLFYATEKPGIRPPGRVRFSIAHELGHYFLPEHRSYLLSGHCHSSHADFVSGKGREREADLFAATLLMPREVFLQEIRKLPGRFCTLSDLERLASSVFLTSITSTAIRYAELSTEACCVVLSKGGTVLYSLASADMRSRGLAWIPRGNSVASTSVTGRLIASASRDAAERLEGGVDARVWFDRGANVPLWEEARLLGPTGLVLTFLANAE